ncbi:hypothetical protein J437_LFUL005191 [Ladona fulva]|uniref:Peptidase S1 domain-containing protein n=1 Tax=Ladona fulva TaxID=123851 RepID=A0A8K0KKS5_LADFU|nr:hypothetical protein J437_LFUL005191 [Ladona fulva]
MGQKLILLLECGRTHSNRIVGGTKAESGEWCWQAKLMIWKRGPHTSLFLCGGSVINEQYILSAAHCFYGYKPLTKANDIAIIKLTKKIEYNDRICSVCLPTKNEDYTGETAIVTGWGALKSGGDSPESLMEAQVNIISYQRCKRSYGYLQPSQMCASAPGTDSCQGDSGGPLVHKSSEGFWELIGIVSAGRGCADKHYPGLYTNVYMFLPWIYEITSEDGYCPSN